MTFPFFPNRSSSDDDALDQQLNQWATGSNTDPVSDEAADALEFHRWADSSHRSDPAATGPAAGTWNRVLRNSAQESSKRSSKMSSTTLTAQSPGFSRIPGESFRQRSGRYATLAATVAIVLAVAFGGWLAMSQMPGGDDRFAAIPGTPEVAQSQTCDVDPMTVDEVMEIVENPYKYAEPGDYGSPDTSPAPWYDDFAEVQPMTSDFLTPLAGEIPTAAAMDQAIPVLQEYIACVETKTVAHSLRFVDPFSIQERVVTEFPFYRDQKTVREWVSEWISQGPQSLNWVDEDTGEVLVFTPNSNIDEARTSFGWIGLGFNQILLLGSNVLNEDGDLLARHDGTMQLVDGEKQSRFVMYTLVYSMYTEQWYVVTSWWPLEPRI